MTDTFDLFDQPLSKDVSVKRNVTSYKDPLLYGNINETNEFIILLEEQPSEAVLRKLVLFIKSQTLLPFLIYSVLPFSVKDPINTNVTKFYNQYSIDLEKIIKPWSKIITCGRSLVSITKSQDLDIEGFYDYILNKTYFFSQRVMSYIFPTDALYTWLTSDKIKDNWNYFFFLTQLKNVLQFKVQPFRIAKLQVNEIIDSTKFFNDYLDYVGLMAFDIETVGLDPWGDRAKIICISVAFEEYVSYVIKWDTIDLNLFNKFLANKKLIGHNIKYDLKWICVHGADRKTIHVQADTLQGSHLLNEMQASRLKSDAYIHTPYGGYDDELVEYLSKHPEAEKDYSLIPWPLLKDYAGKDASITFQIYLQQQKHIKELDIKFPLQNSSWSLYKYYHEIMTPSIETYLDIELEGIEIDKQRLIMIGDQLIEEINAVKTKLFKIWNIEYDAINIDSPDELGIFLEVIGWPPVSRGKTKIKPAVAKKIFKLRGGQVTYLDYKKGVYLTGEDQLDTWTKAGVNGVELLIEYRKLNTLVKMFVGKVNKMSHSTSSSWLYEANNELFTDSCNEENINGYWDLIKWDGRIHPDFSVMLALSHRNKCKNPNLQQIPHHDIKYSKMIRSIFKIPDDYVWDEKDAAGLQLRIGAALSGDPQMKRVFTELGGDMHSMTAVAVLKRDVSLEEFIKRKKEHEFSEVRFRSKCYTGDTRLLTNKGEIKFIDFIPEINPGEFTDYNGNLLIIDENNIERQITHTYFDYSDTIYEFETEEGILKVTPYHKMIIIRNNKEIEIFAKDVLNSDLCIFIDKQKKLIKILSIDIKKYIEPIPVYCINVEPYHRIIVNNFLSKQSVNFGFEFGQSGYAFAEGTLMKEWPEPDIDKYIKENDLQERYRSLYRKCHRGDENEGLNSHLSHLSEKFIKYWTVGISIRDKFFMQYVGLEKWINNSIKFATENGYVRSPYGAIRRLPQLTYQGADDNKRDIKNFQNIALNSPVQNVEAVLINNTMNKVNQFIKQHNLKTRLKANVHDAIIHMTHKEEIDIIREFEYSIFNEDIPENNGIPMLLESNIADMTIGEVWGYGKEI